MTASFENVDLLNVLSSPPSSLLLDSGEQRKLTVLRRPELEAVRDEVQRIVEIPAHLQRYSKRVIVGPAGVGKSLLLYLCARDCIVNGSWFVLYIASTTRFDEQQDMRVAVEILNMILEINASLFAKHENNEGLKNIRESALNGVRKSEQATGELMNVLGYMSRCNVPVFVGIDQWNCLQKDGGIEQPLLKKLFGHFSKFNGNWGFTLLAVSSSFDLSNSGMFADYDAVLAPKKINLYRTEEWQEMVIHYRNGGLLPPITQLSDEDLLKLTGTVPRLLMVVKQEYISMNTDPTWSPTNTVNVRNANLKYFTERVKRVIQRHCDKDNLVFAACVVTNQYELQLSASNPWIDSGLFYLKEGVPVPIASDVLIAMYDVVSSSFDTILGVIAQTEAKGVAFQMFIELGFTKRQSMLEFPIRGLGGGPDKGAFSLIVANRIMQQKDNLNLTIGDNTMVVCFQHHPVVDAVIYSFGVIYLVSISISSYSHHTTTASDIFRCNVGDSGKSVLRYYCDISPYGAAVKEVGKSKNWNNKLKEYVKFVYITTDTTDHNRSTMTKSGANAVYRINGDDLKVFGRAYELFK